MTSNVPSVPFRNFCLNSLGLMNDKAGCSLKDSTYLYICNFNDYLSKYPYSVRVLK